MLLIDSFRQERVRIFKGEYKRKWRLDIWGAYCLTGKDEGNEPGKESEKKLRKEDIDKVKVIRPVKYCRKFKEDEDREKL